MDINSLPEIKCITDEGAKATFLIDPLAPGFGVTIGNSLRRTLLATLEGAAVTQAKISGITHEFSTIPNIKEDVIDIVLQLKKLRFRKHNTEPTVLSLTTSKPGAITAADFSKNPDVEIFNPELVIATLDSKKGKFELEITVESGRGYEPIEQRENEKNELGVIAIDALFNPVRQVNYNVENTRVGDQTNLDKLTLEITTDGTIDAKETLDFAANILVRHFALFTHEGVADSAAKIAASEREEAGEDLGKIKVEEINLSTRTLNALLKNDIKTLSDVFKQYEDLPSLPGLGARAVTEIKDAVDKIEKENESKKAKK